MTLWTEEQVRCLNAYQNHGRYHPFTCPNRGPLHPGELVAYENGWVCPTCDYTQDWAHDFMLTYNPDEHLNWWENKSIGDLAKEVVRGIPEKLDGSPITTYLDVSKEENPK